MTGGVQPAQSIHSEGDELEAEIGIGEDGRVEGRKAAGRQRGEQAIRWFVLGRRCLVNRSLSSPRLRSYLMARPWDPRDALYPTRAS